MDPHPSERVERPVPRLFTYYVLMACAAFPALPVLLPYFYFRYHTLRYRLDEEGLSMSWGILFRREIHLTYARIQDIHLVSNVLERWLGLARIQIQTASGSSGAQMTLEGIADHEAMRDFLYAKLRGSADPVRKEDDGEAAAVALRDLAEELRALRQQLEASRRQIGKAGSLHA
jgi:putative membrane protein